jgi:hypothetical protein
MAGEWLKFEANTPEKPEVFAITVALGWDDPDLTVGKLLKVWRWFDQHTTDGNAASVSLALLDRIAGVTGLSQAMCDVGWLVQIDGGLTLPNFARHNGKTAKERAQTAKRVANHKSNAGANGEGNGESVSGALAREEKSRKEKKESKTKTSAAPAYDPKPDLVANGVGEQTMADWLALRTKKRAPVTATVLAQLLRETEKAGMSLDDALALCCVRGWTGFEADWVLKNRDSPAGSPTRFNPTAHVNRNRTNSP